MIRPGALLKLNFPFNRWTKSKASKYFLFSFTKSFLDALPSLKTMLGVAGTISVYKLASQDALEVM